MPDRPRRPNRTTPISTGTRRRTRVSYWGQHAWLDRGDRGHTRGTTNTLPAVFYVTSTYLVFTLAVTQHAPQRTRGLVFMKCSGVVTSSALGGRHVKLTSDCPWAKSNQIPSNKTLSKSCYVEIKHRLPQIDITVAWDSIGQHRCRLTNFLACTWSETNLLARTWLETDLFSSQTLCSWISFEK